jgi:hypothetical protein
MKTPKLILTLSAGFNFAAALLSTSISLIPSWGGFFGLPEELASNGPLRIATGQATATFFGMFGVYAIAGVGYIRSLPMLRWILLGIVGIYGLLGLALLPMIFLAGVVLAEIPAPGFVSAPVLLFTGVLCLAGTRMSWRDLQSRSNNPSRPKLRTGRFIRPRPNVFMDSANESGTPI